ncbi:MAG TPA: hypothetical protein VFW96_19425 [Thermomicrobiales bacterium]|nr:hypothetical protein [Thermomicrobiales bacterium]
MAETIPVEAYRSGLLTILEEVFETVHGYVLDPATSLFETLATVSAAEASRPVHAHGSNLAAQVNHLRFYIDVMIEGARTEEQRPADWASSWRVGAVTEDEWHELVERLRVAYGQVRAFAGSFEGWDAGSVGGAFALVGHCAYHLGEIRQGLGVLRG